MQNAKEIGVLLFPRFSNHCLANAVEPLRAANTLARRTLYRWQYLSVDGARVESSSGLPVQPGRLKDHPGGDCLFVMPSYGFRDYLGPPVLGALRAASKRFGAVAGLDTGSWLLAAAGLLEGKRATIHWDELDAFEEAFPEVRCRPDRWVIDGNRMSSGGTTTTLELMLKLIERDHGGMLALDVAALFMHGERAPRLDPVLRVPPEGMVQAAVALMRRNVETPLKVAEIAGRLGVTPRALEQHFAAALGRAPRSVYAAVRLGVARRLLEQTRLSVAEIAGRAGYGDASAMARAFRAEFGLAPSAARKGAG
ncbi:GlxA family transcriptional regulator [Pseudoroseicyclus sp. CXY001]|uniref:GlxA family transcriptional regulator n=1 Tax=Pseudoroseicyclus sp. CXY001 TaxID=3242492 RepID=UPI00358DC5BD